MHLICQFLLHDLPEIKVKVTIKTPCNFGLWTTAYPWNIGAERLSVKLHDFMKSQRAKQTG